MEPYAAEDRVYAYTMDFRTQAGNRDRYFRHAKQCNETPEQAQRFETQQYFYRAMHRPEALAWLMTALTAFPYRSQVYIATPGLHIAGHQGWASHREFSMEYLSPRHGYTHLLEAHAPNFLSSLSEIGVKNGKVESGDMSWGMGLTNSNGFNPGDETNKNLSRLYGELFNQGEPVKGTRVRGGLKAMANAVTPHVFLRSLEEMTLVDLRSVP